MIRLKYNIWVYINLFMFHHCTDFIQHLSFLPIRYNPPEWVSTPGHPCGKWYWATPWQSHSWLCTNEQHKAMGDDGPWIFFTQMLFFVGNSVACVKTYSTFFQLCSDGFHQHRNRGGRACDVGGARVDHSCAALSAKHLLPPHRNTKEKKRRGVKLKTCSF